MACKLHRVRYYNPKPESIQCASFNKNSKRIALARNNASIEIWDIKYAPYLIKYIPGIENASIEALGWVQNRLLSTGLSGNLIEWDIEKLCIRRSTILTGYAAWCLDIDPANTLVAVGTEQGYINLYSVENDDIVYQKLFDKQEGRIMCCKFDNTGRILVTGSVDTIRVWNVGTGHATCRISVKRQGNETIVWCLAVLSDNVIVSGDSHGRLTFWDGVLGDQIESYPTHKADILSIAVTDDETNLYCSGIDPVIMHFRKVPKGELKEGKQSEQWVKNVQRNIHEHDVRALLLHREKLISVGADGYLTLSSYPPKWVMRVPPMVPCPRLAVCKQKKLLLLRFNNYLEVWKLGSYDTNDSGHAMLTDVNANGVSQYANNSLEQDSDVLFDKMKPTKRCLKVTDNPQKLVTIDTKKKKQVLCCDMSPDGELIVYSTESHMRILKLTCDEDVSIKAVLVSGMTRCSHATFTADSRTLITHHAGELRVLHVDPDAGATVVQTITTDKYLKSNSVLHLIVSKNQSKSSYLVVAGTAGDIAVWVRNSKKYEFHAALPKYDCIPTAITIIDEKNTLIITYVDQKIIEYDLVNKIVGPWPGEMMPKRWRFRRAAVTGVTSHPHRDALVFQDDTSLWVVERKTQDDDEEPAVKKKQEEINVQKLNMRIVTIKYLAGFHWLGEDEAVALEILPENIISQLPPVLATKRRNVE